MSTHLPVGVFDSGVGGLSVVRAIRARMPDLDIYYVADSAHAPYGDKSAEYVQQRARRITAFLLDQGVAAMVVACNTATAMAVEQLRTEFQIPIVAMEPAIKPAVAATRSGVIGVLATAGTLESERYRKLLARHGQQVKVMGSICHSWVGLVESGRLSGVTARDQVAAHVLPLVQAGADTLVLGCTHFPFLVPLIQEVAGAGVTLIDPAPAVAGQLASCLQGHWQGQGMLNVWSSHQAGGESERLSRVLGETVMVQHFPAG